MYKDGDEEKKNLLVIEDIDLKSPEMMENIYMAL